MLREGLIFLALVLAASGRQELDSQWEEFKAKYNKVYEAEAEDLRRSIWEANFDFMEEHNAAFEAGFETYTVGENEYNDLTTEEFVKMMNGLQISEESISQNEVFEKSEAPLPAKVDWRTKGYVTPVKDQKQCGSCWAFSTTGSLEGAHFKKTQKLVSLSEQNLVDCSMKEGNHGCFGGLMDFAFKYIKENNGIDTEESYPYTAKTGLKCLFKNTTVGATLTRWVDVKKGSEEDLAAAVATVGPVSVGIDASHPGFHMYKNGVYTDKSCSSSMLDHGVLAVGYNNQVSEDGKKKHYWIVKNSWGESWGMKGYINMAKDHKNMCGISTAASFPVV